MVKEPVERLKEKVLKENLWIFLFKLLKEEDNYAYALRKEVRNSFGFWVGEVTGYRVLYLLEKDRYVESYLKGRKRYYKLTKKGMEQLYKAKKFFNTVLRSI
jgi:DNA-binding PadR family transcriptional regulator